MLIKKEQLLDGIQIKHLYIYILSKWCKHPSLEIFSLTLSASQPSVIWMTFQISIINSQKINNIGKYSASTFSHLIVECW